MSTNGRLDVADLATIPGGTKMGGSALIRRDLLPGLVGLQAAYAKRWGDPLRPTSAADGYRSYEVQVRTFLARYVEQRSGVGPFSDVRYWDRYGTGQPIRYVRVSSAGSAAIPGRSNHGWAIAVDFADVGASGGERHKWLMDAAPRFGFVNPLWARDGIPTNGSQEPWHWEGSAVPVSNYRTYLADHGIPLPGVTAPDPITPEDDMAGIKDDPQVQAALKAIAKAAVKEALVETDQAVADRADAFGRHAQDAALARARVEAHHVLTGAAGRSTATFRQIGSAITALTHVPAPEAVADLDDEALAALAQQLTDLPRLVADEQDRRARARLGTA